MNLNNIISFLKFGYFLDYKNTDIQFDLSEIDKDKYQGYSEKELINLGAELLLNTIKKSFEINQKHLVPISGGLDSRAILGGLLKFTESKNIHTYTFGTPGTLDYDIGNYIAKKTGTNHTAYPLTKHEFSFNEEVDFSKRIDHQSILFHHAPLLSLDKNYSDYHFWSGFMGDPVAGSHLLANPSLTKEEAATKFVQKNTFVRSTSLLGHNMIDSSLEDYLNSSLTTKINLISLDELLDFKHRQLKYIAPHVLMKGFHYKTPFLEKEWFNFMMSIPDTYRYDQYLYNEILINTYPKLFSFKTKHNFGLPLRTNKIMLNTQKAIHFIKRKSGLFVNPSINYIDFANGIRQRKDLNKLVYENIMDLKARNIVDWICIDNIWRNHINRNANNADALIVLASLEIHLKAGKKI